MLTALLMCIRTDPRIPLSTHRAALEPHTFVIDFCAILGCACIFSGIAFAQNYPPTYFVVPGQPGNFDVQVTNDAESAVPMQNVFMNYTDDPSFLHVPQPVGPVDSIAIGAESDFTFPYTIDSGAPDGTYTANFAVVPENTPDSESPDGSMTVQVSFSPQPQAVFDGRGVPLVFRTEPFAFVKHSFLAVESQASPTGRKQRPGC